MLKAKIMKILTSTDDDFLYTQLLRLLSEIKLVQGIPAVSSTLRRHSLIKSYLISKQVDKINFLEDRYFVSSSNDLNHVTIRVDSQKYLQN